MDKLDKISFLESNLARQLGWISAADKKASFIFGIDTAMLGVLAAISPAAGKDWSVAPATMATLALFFGVTALLFLCFATFPRTTGPKGSILFFGGIANRSSKQFEDAVTQLTQESYIQDLSLQCHRNAEIADCKFDWVRKAQLALYISVLPWGIAIFLLYNG